VIAVSVHPGEIPVDWPVEMTLRLTNTGVGACTNVRLTFRLPLEILLIRGRRQVQVARLGRGEHHDHLLQVRARKEGAFRLVSTNFSYRDPAGRGRRVPETAVPLRVVAPVRVPIPELELALETASLPLGEWSPLSGRIVNTGEVPAYGVTLSVAGPSLQAHGEMVGDLPPGDVLPFTLSTRVTEAGTRVPIRLEAAFRGGNGEWHQCSRRAYLVVGATQLSDIFKRYEEGLRRLLGQLGEVHPRYSEGLVLESRLLENINQARQYGDMETRRADRAQILAALNRMTMETVGSSFNKLCGLDD
jgi:hypothetical protein